MSFRISGKNIEISQSWSEHVQKRIDEMVERYFGAPYSGHVTLSREGTGFRTDCFLHFDSGMLLEASGFKYDVYDSFKEMADHIEKQIRRYKQRLKKRPRPQASGELAYEELVPDVSDKAETDEEEGNAAAYHPLPITIAERKHDLPVLTLEEAVRELSLEKLPVSVFLHAASRRINIIYRREDGTVGWIDPLPSDPSSALA